jgi:hypothetical protein
VVSIAGGRLEGHRPQYLTDQRARTDPSPPRIRAQCARSHATRERAPSTPPLSFFADVPLPPRLNGGGRPSRVPRARKVGCCMLLRRASEDNSRRARLAHEREARSLCQAQDCAGREVGPVQRRRAERTMTESLQRRRRCHLSRTLLSIDFFRLSAMPRRGSESGEPSSVGGATSRRNRQLMGDLLTTYPDVNRHVGEMTSGVATRYDLGDGNPLLPLSRPQAKQDFQWSSSASPMRMPSGPRR